MSLLQQNPYLMGRHGVNVTNNAPLGTIGQPVLYSGGGSAQPQGYQPLAPSQLFPPLIGASGGGLGSTVGGAFAPPPSGGAMAPSFGTGGGVPGGMAYGPSYNGPVQPHLPPGQSASVPGGFGGGASPAGAPPASVSYTGASTGIPAPPAPAQAAAANPTTPGQGNSATGGANPGSLTGFGPPPSTPGSQTNVSLPYTPQGWSPQGAAGQTTSDPNAAFPNPGLSQIQGLAGMVPGYGAPSGYAPPPSSSGAGTAAGADDSGYNPNLFNQIAAGAPPMGWAGAFTSGVGPSMSLGGGGGFGGGFGGGGGFGVGAPSFPTSMGGAGGGAAGGAGGGFHMPQFGGGSPAGLIPSFGSPTSGLAASGGGTSGAPGPGGTGSAAGGGVGPYQSTDPNAPNYTTPALAAQYNSLLGAQGQGQPGASGATGSSSGTGGPSQGLTQALSGSQQSALNDANAANLSLLQSVLQGYGGLQNQLTGTLGQTTNQQFQNLINQRNQANASVEQQLIDRGLDNSTVLPSVQRGVTQDYNMALNNLQDSRLQQLLGIQGQLGQNALNTLASVNLQGPNPAFLAQLTQGIGQSGQNPASWPGASSGGVVPPVPPPTGGSGSLASAYSNLLGGLTGPNLQNPSPTGGASGLGGFLGTGGSAVPGGGSGAGGPLAAQQLFTGSPMMRGRPIATGGPMTPLGMAEQSPQPFHTGAAGASPTPSAGGINPLAMQYLGGNLGGSSLMASPASALSSPWMNAFAGPQGNQYTQMTGLTPDQWNQIAGQALNSGNTSHVNGGQITPQVAAQQYLAAIQGGIPTQFNSPFSNIAQTMAI